MTMKQKDIVVAILNEGIQAGHQGEALTEFAKGKVREGLADGTIPWSGDRSNPKKVSNYATGVVGNYLKKNPEFHDGVAYKDRKSTRGPRDTDPRLVDLKANLASLRASADPEHQALIPRVEQAIADIRAELKAAKQGSTVRPITEVMDSLAAMGLVDSAS